MRPPPDRIVMYHALYRRLPLALVACLLVLAGCAADRSQPAETPPATAVTPAATADSEDGFTVLFDGETLDGWRRHDTVPSSDVGGHWVVEDGAIVGDQEPPGRGGFLITEERYGDFELRLEARLDYPVDSGIFLRMGDDGKSHQVTLDYRPDGDIGAIYLPWTQGSVLRNPDGIEHFERDAWNELEVRIEGEPARIQFRVNGQLVTDFQHTGETTQGVPREGYIGLQVHPGASYEAGKKVRFRNIRIRPL